MKAFTLKTLNQDAFIPVTQAYESSFQLKDNGTPKELVRGSSFMLLGRGMSFLKDIAWSV